MTTSVTIKISSLKALSLLAASGHERPALNGINFRVLPNHTTLAMATDKRVMGVLNLGVNEDYTPGEFTIPITPLEAIPQWETLQTPRDATCDIHYYHPEKGSSDFDIDLDFAAEMVIHGKTIEDKFPRTKTLRDTITPGDITENKFDMDYVSRMARCCQLLTSQAHARMTFTQRDNAMVVNLDVPPFVGFIMPMHYSPPGVLLPPWINQEGI